MHIRLIPMAGTIIGCVLAQAPPAPAPAKPTSDLAAAVLTKKARIEGVVVDDRYQRPLKRGMVILKPKGMGRSPSGETDDAGRFFIDNIEPGEYTVEARRDGYLSAYWGRRGGIRMPRVFSIYPGEQLLDFTFRLEAWAALEGKVRFNDGEPAYGVPVILYRKEYSKGRLQYLPAGSARTNDRGDYRIAALAPGSYIVAAIYNKPVKPRTPDDDPFDAPDSEWSYATTFYTSGQRLSDAMPVKIEAGRELTGLDIFLGLVRAVRMRIQVTDTCTGELATKATVQLYRMDENNNPVLPVNSDIASRGGQFLVRGLGPGQYMIVATSDPPANCQGPLRDRRSLAVNEYPVDGVEMGVKPPIYGRFNFLMENAATGPYAFHLEARSGLPGLNVNLERQRSSNTLFGAWLDPQEEYDLMVDRKPADAYLKGPLQLTEGRGVQVSNRGALVNGTVMNEKREPVSGATITLIPDPAKGRFQHYTEVYSNELGAFSSRGLAPGKYIAVPWLDVAPCDFYNWDDQEPCRQVGVAVSVGEAEAKSVELVLKLNN